LERIIVAEQKEKIKTRGDREHTLLYPVKSTVSRAKAGFIAQEGQSRQSTCTVYRTSTFFSVMYTVHDEINRKGGQVIEHNVYETFFKDIVQPKKRGF
jgi:hypothetical protein